MSGATTDLSDMVIEEISLVDEPASPGAHVEIFKRAGAQDDTSMSAAAVIATVLNAMEAMSDEIITKALTGSGSGSADQSELAKAVFNEVLMDITELNKALQEAEDRIAAAEGAITKANADHAAELAAKDGEIAKLNGEIQKGKKKKGDGADKEPDGDPDDEEFMKSLPESIRKQLEEGREAKVELAKAREKQELDAAIAKAKTLGSGDPEVIGPLLLRVRKGMTTEADASALETLLKSTAKIVDASNLFRVAGAGGGGAEAEPDAIMKAKAEDIFKAANGGLTKEQAYTQACNENPQIYDQIAKRR